MSSEAELLAVIDSEIARWQLAALDTQHLTLAQYLARILVAFDGRALVSKAEPWSDHRTRCHDYNPDAVIAHLHSEYDKAEGTIVRLRSVLHGIADDQSVSSLANARNIARVALAKEAIGIVDFDR